MSGHNCPVRSASIKGLVAIKIAASPFYIPNLEYNLCGWFSHLCSAAVINLSDHAF